jgi:hypothetical protein
VHKYNIERNADLDGTGEVYLKAASSVYFVETRAGVQDIAVCPYAVHWVSQLLVVLPQVIMNHQLYTAGRMALFGRLHFRGQCPMVPNTPARL